MPNDAYDEVRKVYPQAHQDVAGIYDRDPTKSNSRYLGKDWNDARSHLLPAQLLGTCDLHGLEHPESIWCVRWTPLPAQPCDGDHASPPCADKDCWHRCPNCGGDPCLPNCKYGEAAQPAQAEPDCTLPVRTGQLPDWCKFVCPACRALAGQPCINGASCMERVLLQGLADTGCEGCGEPVYLTRGFGYSHCDTTLNVGCNARPNPNHPSAPKLDRLYYIQDTRTYCGNSVMWWMPEGYGYTSNLNDAWKVPASWKGRDTDKLWPCDEIDLLSTRQFDMQLFHSIKAQP